MNQVLVKFLEEKQYDAYLKCLKIHINETLNDKTHWVNIKKEGCALTTIPGKFSTIPMDDLYEMILKQYKLNKDDNKCKAIFLMTAWAHAMNTIPMDDKRDVAMSIAKTVIDMGCRNIFFLDFKSVCKYCSEMLASETKKKLV